MANIGSMWSTINQQMIIGQRVCFFFFFNYLNYLFIIIIIIYGVDQAHMCKE